MGQRQGTASASSLGWFRSHRGVGTRTEITPLVFPKVWVEVEGGAWLQCLTLCVMDQSQWGHQPWVALRQL